MTAEQYNQAINYSSKIEDLRSFQNNLKNDVYTIEISEKSQIFDDKTFRKIDYGGFYDEFLKYKNFIIDEMIEALEEEIEELEKKIEEI